MNIEEEIARQNREIEDSLAKMKESINAQMKRMMEAANPLKFQRAKKDETEDNESEEIVKGQIKWDDIEDWNCTFVYEYERKGKAVSMRVDLINTDDLFLALNDVPLSEEQEPKNYKKIDIEFGNNSNWAAHVYEQKMKAAFITLSDPTATDEEKEDAKNILDDIKRKL